MRIVITRPQRSCEKTAAKLTELGHEPVPLTLFEPVHHTEPTKHALSKTLSAIAITSVEALRAMEPLRGALAPHLAKPLFAVGEATADAARCAGFKKVLVAEGNGRALARTVSENRNLFCETAPILYLAGAPRTQVFEAGLSKAAIAHRTVECYEMRPSHLSQDQLNLALLSRPVDMVLLYSSETARTFFKIAMKEPYTAMLSATRFLCISQNVLSHIPGMFFANAIAASATDETAIFDIISCKTGT